MAFGRLVWSITSMLSETLIDHRQSMYVWYLPHQVVSEGPPHFKALISLLELQGQKTGIDYKKKKCTYIINFQSTMQTFYNKYWTVAQRGTVPSFIYSVVCVRASLVCIQPLSGKWEHLKNVPLSGDVNLCFPIFWPSLLKLLWILGRYPILHFIYLLKIWIPVSSK